MSVAQLCCACVDPAWRKRFLAGEHPELPGAPAAAGPQAQGDLNGLQDHGFADLARVLTRRLRSDPAADAHGHDQLLAQLYDLGAGTYVQGLLDAGQVDAAAQFITALHRYCGRLLQLRGQEGKRSFREIFPEDEHSAAPVALSTRHGDLLVSGAIAGLRADERGQLEIAGSQLMAVQTLPSATVQVALYRRLLQQRMPDRPLRAVLESYLPTLQVTELSADDLERVYREEVAPVLDELTRGLRGPGPAEPVEAAADGAEADAEPPSVAEPEEAVELSGADFQRHTAVLGGSGSGKTDLVLNIVEQVLESGVPVLIVDRQGDLARYADEAAWQAQDEPERTARRRALFERLDVALFTPGHGAGRPLRLTLVPPLAEASPEERAQAFEAGARILADMMRLPATASGTTLRRVLVAAMACLSEREGAVYVPRVIALLRQRDPAFVAQLGPLAAQVDVLLERLAAFALMNQELLAEDGEPLDAERLLGLDAGAVPERVRLTIVSTHFVDGDAALSWVAQLLGELNRFVAPQRSTALRALVLFDEADLYVPLASEPITKAPLERLLEVGEVAGIGVVLAARNPGALDHARCQPRVNTWLVGRLREPRALSRLQPLAAAAGLDPVIAFPNQAFGQFHLISDAGITVFQGERPLLDPEPLSGRQILDLARATRGETLSEGRV